MSRDPFEIFVGVFVLALALVAVLACRFAATMLGDESYILYADFASILGLHVSDPVTIAGVRVGEVDSISLKDYQARVSMRIGHDVQVRQDAVASTESLGFALMGDKRVLSILELRPNLSAQAMKLQKPIRRELSRISRANGSREIFCRMHSDGGSFRSRSQTSDLPSEICNLTCEGKRLCLAICGESN